jgi:hypothetical protein
MGALARLAFCFALTAAAVGCSESVPDKAVLSPAAQDVEIISDLPNREIYEPAGLVSAQIIGRDNAASLREAFNQLRNQAAAKGATFVGIEEVSSRAAWDFSGRTVVTLIGTAYRTK